MGGTVRRCTLGGALALAAIAAPSVSGAQVVDCWLLDGHALEQSRAQGACQDAFARNSGNGVRKEATQEAGQRRPPRQKRERTVAVATARQGSGEAASWDAPQEGNTAHRAEDAQIVESGANALRYEPPPPVTDPVTAALFGLKQDFQDFVDDVRRDFGSFARTLVQAGSAQPRGNAPSWDR